MKHDKQPVAVQAEETDHMAFCWAVNKEIEERMGKQQSDDHRLKRVTGGGEGRWER